MRGVSAAALFLLFQRLKFNALLETLRTMRPGWFAAAILANGLAFVPATWRWHLVLRLTGNAVHPSATARLSLIGHFFYLILFGAAGGDTAKAALYARWFRLPFASILATAPLDRFLGFGGLVCFTTIALLLASVTGAFKTIGSIAFNWHKSWWLVLLLVILAILWLAKRSRSESGWVTRERAGAGRQPICSALRGSPSRGCCAACWCRWLLVPCWRLTCRP